MPHAALKCIREITPFLHIRELLNNDPTEKKLVAGEPVSRILSRAPRFRCAHGRPFLWAPNRFEARAAYPRVIGPGRSFPPIWPCSMRGLPSLACYHASGGLLPHLFTLTAAPPLERCPKVSLWSATEAARAGGIFSVVLSVALASRPAPPGVTRRIALRSPDFPPSCAAVEIAFLRRRSAIAQLARSRNYILPCPPLPHFISRAYRIRPRSQSSRPAASPSRTSIRAPLQPPHSLSPCSRSSLLFLRAPAPAFQPPLVTAC
jgi:hypothetical protein